MMSSLYRALFERRWNRDRRRRIDQMLDHERAGNAAVLDWIDAMATQLAEIRTLPEAPDVRR
jgi:hypothetical protein